MTAHSYVETRVSHGALRGLIEPVRGAGDARVMAFRGIPFAAPPTGARRFAAPAPAEPWRGVRDALHSGAAPSQNAGALLGSRPITAMSEDCLYLDVYTPALHGARPVMLWIYGGGFISGSGGDLLTQGQRLAHFGDAVVVTCNYRLGAFGFLLADEDPAHSGAAVTNAGVLDQLAVLRWIQAEISQFGGDPQRVTIFGESAGGMSVCNLLAMPQAAGLFHRAIAQSGFAASVQSAESAAAIRRELCAALSVADGDIEALRRCDASALLAAQQQVLVDLRRQRRGMAFRPTLDGATLPEIPLQAIAAGRAHAVPLIIGTNLDEQRLFMAPRQELSDEALLAHVTARLRMMRGDSLACADTASSAIALYRQTRTAAEYGSNAAIACAIETELSFRIPALRLAAARLAAGNNRPASHQPASKQPASKQPASKQPASKQPASKQPASKQPASKQPASKQPSNNALWMYLLAWKSPALRGWLGACHAIDVPFVFGNLDAPGMRRFAGSGPAAESLARQMLGDWSHFAHTGAPSHKDWRPYRHADRCTMHYKDNEGIAFAPYDEERAFWAQALAEHL